MNESQAAEQIMRESIDRPDPEVLGRYCRVTAHQGTEDFHRRLGITLLDAKPLDPKCWDGCQSLIHKHRIERLEAMLRRVLEWCEQDSPAVEIDADAIRDVLNPQDEKGQS